MFHKARKQYQFYGYWDLNVSFKWTLKSHRTNITQYITKDKLWNLV